MKLTSPAFVQSESIPRKYTCEGENIHPPLVISDVPVGTKSLNLIMTDPDSPHGVFTHWIIIHLDPHLSNLAEGSIPAESLEGENDFGEQGYGGPCPQQGLHHYIFTLYALDLDGQVQNLDKKNVSASMNGHILASTTLIGTYQKQQI